MALEIPDFLGADNAGNEFDYEAWPMVIAALRAANAGQFQGFKNALMNGAFNVWQRGTSFSSIADATFFADRWRYFKSGAMVHDVSRSTDVPTVAQAGRLFNYSALVDCTTVDAAIAAGDYCFIEQRVEGFNWLALAQRACVLQFWVKATKTGTYCVAVRNSAADRAYVGEYTVSVSDTWEFKTVTITASPSGGTWDYTTGVGARVSFALAAGSTYQGAAGSWLSADNFATSSQVNACDSTSNNFRIVGVQIEACDATELDYTPFEHVPFDVDLRRCMRYYEKSFAYATAPAQNAGVNTGEFIAPIAAAGAVQNYGVQLPFRVRKRAAPTMTLFNPVATNGQWNNEVTGIDCSSAAVAGASEIGCRPTFVQDAGAAANNIAGVHWTASAEL